jgi:hypothetical protein
MAPCGPATATGPAATTTQQQIVDIITHFKQELPAQVWPHVRRVQISTNGVQSATGDASCTAQSSEHMLRIKQWVVIINWFIV